MVIEMNQLAMRAEVQSTHASDAASELTDGPTQRLNLASTNLFRLPSEIRNKIYRILFVAAEPLLLFQDRGSELVESFAPNGFSQTFALLYTNRQIYHEASAILYGSNSFTFVDRTHFQVDLLQSFLKCIGPRNASVLSYLCINFPAVEFAEGHEGNITLRDDSLRTMRLLQEKCIGLRTLEAFVYGENFKGLTRTDSNSPQFIQEGLSQIDGHLKAINSLENVIIVFYDGAPSLSTSKIMHAFGWITRSGR